MFLLEVKYTTFESPLFHHIYIYICVCILFAILAQVLNKIDRQVSMFDQSLLKTLGHNDCLTRESYFKRCI